MNKKSLEVLFCVFLFVMCSFPTHGFEIDIREKINEIEQNIGQNLEEDESWTKVFVTLGPPKNKYTDIEFTDGD